MATIRRRLRSDGSAVYHAQVRLKGHRPETATFTRKTDARAWVQDTESAIRHGRHFKTSESKRHTVSEMIDRYIREEIPRKRDGATQARQLEWWKRQIGDWLLADVTPKLIREYREKLAGGQTVRGTIRSPSTVNRRLAALSHVFTVAAKEFGWVEDNPLRNVKKKQEPDGRVRFLTEDERDRLLTACRESPCPDLYPIVLFALSTGARKGEVMNLRWPDVDCNRGLAIFPKTKNNERRSVSLTGRLLKVMRERAKVRRLDSDLVFPRPDGKKPVDIRNHWASAIKAAEIEDFRFHDLRHTAASYLAMNGATLPEIAAVLGHKTLEMVKRYAHLSDGHVRGVIERMNEKIFG